MNISMKMYQGDYCLQNGKIGHEFINLIMSDDENKYFYIWLNHNGTFDKDLKKDETINILMVRTISDGVYKVLGKATNCSVVDGADPKKYKDPEDRFNKQKNISYDGISLEEIHKNEKNTLVTFKTQNVYKPKKPIFITNNHNIKDGEDIYYLEIDIKSSMRQYFNDDNSDFNGILNDTKLWEENVSSDKINEFIKKYSGLFNNKETMFSILKKEKDEISLSNSISYFLKKYECYGKFLNNLNKNIDENQEFEIYREKENVDLFFIGTKNIVIIENKVDSKINGIKENEEFKKQIDNILRNHKKILKKSEIEDVEIEKELLELGENKKGKISQLSKYFIISCIYAKCKKIPLENVYYFLLIPNYKYVLYPVDNNKFVQKCCGENLIFSTKYKRIGYGKIYNFFKDIELLYHDIYFEDFLDTIKKLTKDTDCVYESKIAEALKKIYSKNRK